MCTRLHILHVPSYLNYWVIHIFIINRTTEANSRLWLYILRYGGNRGIRWPKNGIQKELASGRRRLIYTDIIHGRNIIIITKVDSTIKFWLIGWITSKIINYIRRMRFSLCLRQRYYPIFFIFLFYYILLNIFLMFVSSAGFHVYCFSKIRRAIQYIVGWKLK